MFVIILTIRFFCLDMLRSQYFDAFRKMINVIERDHSTIATHELTTQDSAALSQMFKYLDK